MARDARQLSIAKRDAPDRMLARLAKEPMDRTEAAEPMLATLRTEPTEPMDRNESTDPIDSVLLREARDRREVMQQGCHRADRPVPVTADLATVLG